MCVCVLFLHRKTSTTRWIVVEVRICKNVWEKLSNELRFLFVVWFEEAQVVDSASVVTLVSLELHCDALLAFEN